MPKPVSWTLRDEFPSTSQTRGWESESFSLYTTCQSPAQDEDLGLGLPYVSSPGAGGRGHERAGRSGLLGVAVPEAGKGNSKVVSQEGGGHRDPLRHGVRRLLREHPGETTGPERAWDLFKVTQSIVAELGPQVTSPSFRPGLDYVGRLGFGEEF